MIDVTKEDVMLYATLLSTLCTLGVFLIEIGKSRKAKRAQLASQEEAIEAESSLKNLKPLGYISAILTAVLFGIHHVLAKDLVLGQGALHTVAARNLIGGIILIVFGSMLNRYSPHREDKFFTFNTLSIFIGSTGANVCYALALTSLSATAASALYKLNPIYVFFLVLWLNPRALKQIKWYEALVATAMVSCGAIVAINGNLSLDITQSVSISSGVLLMILAGLMWSIQNVYMKKEDFDPGLNSGKIIYVGKLLVCSSVIVGGSAVAIETEHTFGEITSFSNLTLGVIWGVTFLLTFEAVNRIGALPTTAIASFEVLFTGVFEAVISTLKLTWGLMIGSVLILLGNLSLSKQDSNITSPDSEDSPNKQSQSGA